MLEKLRKLPDDIAVRFNRGYGILTHSPEHFEKALEEKEICLPLLSYIAIQKRIYPRVLMWGRGSMMDFWPFWLKWIAK
jgi:Na+-transporting methylmalonyl-CoA/oxaloacetate decarboxylase beta subunit